jgi:TFIIF-interacting CTD phosphatase-like protein
MIAGCFGNQCMVLTHGKHIKDLKYLNRDLNKIIVVDLNKEIVKKHK